MDSRTSSNIVRRENGSEYNNRTVQSQGNYSRQEIRTISSNLNRGTFIDQGGETDRYSRYLQQGQTISRLHPSQLNENNELQGEFYDNLGEQKALLQWSILPENQNITISGTSDYNILNKLQNILLALRGEYLNNSGNITISGDNKDSLNQRLILLENEINGLMKRKINYSVKDVSGGSRTLDYTILLNQKQNQIIELEKKINNLQERLRRSNTRQLELENHIQLITVDLKRKDMIIQAKNQQILAEVAASNQFRQSLNKLKTNINKNISQLGNGIDKILLDGVSFPEIGAFDIKSDILTKDGSNPRGSNYQKSSSGLQIRTKLVSLIREFQRANNHQQGISEVDFERILEGFLIGLKGTKFTDFINSGLDTKKYQQNYDKIKIKLNTAVALYKAQIQKIKKQNTGIKIDIDKNLIDLIQNDKIFVDRVEGGTVFMERYIEKTIQVPVQDSRTKYLLHLFAVELKKLSTKYPKIYSEIDVRLSEFFQQQVIDVIQTDQLNKLVEIVKYVPQVVKVENVYAYSSEKSRKVEFHLRVLIKALLQQIQKLKRKHGLVLDIDEGVIGMINQQIMGIVDVDDILKVFRVVPKIVEVQKIVQKIVDRVVEVPEVIAVDKVVQKIIQIQKIKQVQKIVNIPIEIPTVVNNIIEKIVPVQTIIQKVVEVPVLSDKIIQLTKQVPKIVEVQVIVQKVVQIQKVIEVQKQVNHFIPQIKEVIVQVQKIVKVQQILQKIVEVPTFIEKIVEKIIQVPQIVEVQKIVQKIVEKIEYKVEKQMIPYVQIQHKIVEKIIEKPIPIIQIEERIVQVAQVVEKIVQVRTVHEQIKEIQVIRDNIIIQQKIKEVIKQVPHVVTVKEEVQKIVQKIIQIPIIVEKIVIVPQIVTKPIIQRIQNTIVKQVPIRDPLIVKEPTIIEVEKSITHYVDVPRVVKHFEQKIVQVPKHIEIIKQVRVNVDKIIEKMVQVPKVVEVQKIVQKVVVVPRVIEKIVQIPQIVQVPVQRIVIQQVIKQIEKIVQVPVFEQKIVEVEIQKNVYIEVEKVVDRIVDKVVEVPKYQEKIQTVEIINQRIIQKIVEVPRQIEVQKIVTNIVEREHIVEIQKPQIIPVQIKVPVQKIVEKLVPVYETKQVVVQVPRVIEKIVQIAVSQVEVKQVQHLTKEIVVDTKIVEVPSERIIIQDKIKQVEVIRQKPIMINSTIQEIVTAQKIIEKIIEKTIHVPKVYEVEKTRQKIVEVPQIVEIQTIVPQLVKVKQYIQNVVEKIVEVPLIIERIKQIQKEKEKIVQVNTTNTQIQQVEKIIQKTVIMQKFKEAVKNINHIQQVLQIVDRIEQKPVPILTKEQKIVQVPHILQKIVEKIVVMPQIVQVLKYVHEVVETDTLGVAVTADVATYEQKYKLLSKNIQSSLDILIKQLNILTRTTPNLKVQIETILKFLGELNNYILTPKIVQVPVQKIVQKIVEKDNIVRIPVQDQRSLRMQLTLSLLVEKLIVELKRVKKSNPNVQLNLDDDINLIFFTEFGLQSNIVNQDFNNQLKIFSDAIYNKFESLGSWTADHQIMLNSFLQERFVMANIVKNCNLEIQKAKSISQKRLQGLRRYKAQKIEYETHTKHIVNLLPKLLQTIKSNPQSQLLSSELESELGKFNTLLTRSVIISGQPMKLLQDLNITDERISSLIRTKDAEILKLKQQLFNLTQTKLSSKLDLNQNIIIQLQTQNTRLTNQINQLTSQLKDPRANADSEIKIEKLNEQILKLEQEKADLQNELRNLNNEFKTKLQITQSEMDQMRIRLGQDRKTTTTLFKQDFRTTVVSAGQTPNRVFKNRQGQGFATPVTGAAGRTPTDQIKHIQSGHYIVNTPGSSVSQQSSTSNTTSNITHSTHQVRSKTTNNSVNVQQSVGGATQQNQTGYSGRSGNLNNSNHSINGTSSVSRFTSSYGTGPTATGGVSYQAYQRGAGNSTMNSNISGTSNTNITSSYSQFSSGYGRNSGSGSNNHDEPKKQ